MLLPLFHAAVVAVNGFSIWYDQQYLDLPSRNKDQTDRMPMKGRLMYLTIWGLILQTVYFSLSLLNDLFGTNEPVPRRAPFIRKVKDYTFGLAFSVAFYVSVSFWGIYNFDKELIFPEALAKVFPVWLNHTMHTTVAVFISFELLFTKKTFPSRKVGFSIIALFDIAYIAWIHILRERLGVWPYPILDVLNLPSRVAFLSVAFLLAAIFYLLGEKLNGLVSSGPKKQNAKNEPKKKRK